jgi:hypothetical protein
VEHDDGLEAENGAWRKLNSTSFRCCTNGMGSLKTSGKGRCGNKRKRNEAGGGSTLALQTHMCESGEEAMLYFRTYMRRILSPVCPVQSDQNELCKPPTKPSLTPASMQVAYNQLRLHHAGDELVFGCPSPVQRTCRTNYCSTCAELLRESAAHTSLTRLFSLCLQAYRDGSCRAACKPGKLNVSVV